MHTVVVFAKEPKPGRVKTRFCPPCTPEQAMQVYQAFVRDTIALVDSVDPARKIVAYAASGDPEWLRSVTGDDWEFRDQGRGDLGDRLVKITGDLTTGSDGGPVIVIGSDSPTLPPEVLHEASDRLADHDVVLGPTDDGGYYLVGLRRNTPRLFWRIPWSTERVWEESIARLRKHGVRWKELPRWYDIDSADVLRRWYENDPDGVDASHTRALIDEMRTVVGIG